MKATKSFVLSWFIITGLQCFPSKASAQVHTNPLESDASDVPLESFRASLSFNKTWKGALLRSESWAQRMRVFRLFLREYVELHGVQKVVFVRLHNGEGDYWWHQCLLQGVRSLASLGQPLYLASVFRPPMSLFAEAHYTAPLLIAPFLTPEHSRLLREMMSYRGAYFCKWLLMSSKDFEELLASVYLPVRNKVQVAVLEDGDQVSLWKQYQGAPHLPPHLSRAGRWLIPGDSQGPNHTKISRGRFEMEETRNQKDLTGLFLRCVTEEWPPFTYLGEQSGSDVDVRGIFRDVWDELQNRLNFTYRCGRDPNRQWGTRMPDGTWSGMVGSLLANEADVLMGSFDKTYPRSKILDYTYALEESRFRLLLQRPNAMGNPWTGYTKEFSPGSWASIVLCLLLGSVLLSTVVCLSPRENNRFTFGEVALTVLGLLCGQGPSFNLTAVSSRAALLMVAAMTQLVFFHYTSALISALATSASPPKISSLADIIASSSHTLGLIQGTSTVDEFNSSSNPLYRDTWDKVLSVRPGSVVGSMSEGVEKAKKDDDFVFFIDEHVYNNVYGQDCRVMVVGPRYMKLKSTITFRAGLPYKPLFDEELLKMEETGVIDSYRLRWRKILPECSAPSTAALSFEQVITAFLVLLMGSTTSVIILVIERWSVNKKKD